MPLSLPCFMTVSGVVVFSTAQDRCRQRTGERASSSREREGRSPARAFLKIGPRLRSNSRESTLDPGRATRSHSSIGPGPIDEARACCAECGAVPAPVLAGSISRITASKVAIEY